ncbi:restriction endonuclease S subunit [Paenibacillus swuensis]|uniref:Restriction endonuclease S subunit n=1 Tax=Paenibacillus swuensis TaxID=1178515 RepID=A0A172TH37_9BACL|nr:restriction endonuclease subunit S [Paenibacillus swuensis]ANE46103.1 restriction endonuclease S subunit [Paenibacillus swuensis]
MNREESFRQMLAAAAKFQWNIALILEAKALEAEKSRNWIVNHLSGEVFADHSDQLKQSMNIHEQMIEVIEGLTKLENGLTKNLKVVLDQDGDSEGGGGSGFPEGLFDLEDSD